MAPDAGPLESGRRAAAVNHLLGQIGVGATDQTRWWDGPQDDLGGRTATQAWLAGNVEAVIALVDNWYDASERAAHEVRSDPARLDNLRAELARLEQRTAHRRLPTA